MMTMRNGGEQAVLDWLADRRGAMLSLLEMLVNTDGGSYDKEGVDRVGGHLRAFLENHGIGCESIPDSRFGDALRSSAMERRVHPPTAPSC
jgi:glutamate carboxypeptidase